jgi:DNA helicase II / ATP-dependent DNA helicase PcrA
MPLDLSELNEAQLEAVEHLEGPLLVLAGAGSGKTRVVTCRIGRLVEQGVDPGSILALTFTNKAAQEMAHRVELLVEARVLVSTFHSLGARILRESSHYLGIAPGFAIYDQDDSEKVLKACMKELGLSDEKMPLRQVRGALSRWKNSGCEEKVEDKDLHVLLQLYQERLRSYGAVDFDDLLLLTLQLLRDHPQVRLMYQARWPYVLIDEYQDTNGVQYQLARHLVGDRCNLFAVGDPDQSIYSWRGAHLGNILNFEQDFPGAKVVRLEQNYRSRANILEAANALIRNNRQRYEKNLWSNLGAGTPCQLYIARDDGDEAAYVMGQIRELVRSDRIPLHQIAILYRTNFQSRPFEDALLRARIPYLLVGAISFYERREVKDILSFLRCMENPSDLVAFVRTVQLHPRGLGATTLERLASLAHQQRQPIQTICTRVADQIRLTQKQRQGLADYLELMERLQALRHLPLKELIERVVEETGYMALLHEEPETEADRAANVGELISVAASWQHDRPDGTLSQFLEELSLRAQWDGAEVQERVHLMTIHSGKGLEYKAVFLVGLEEELFPHSNSLQSTGGIEEERRLCYVGMTRAREQLFLSAAQYRFLWGRLRAMDPSRFLRELPPKCLKKSSSLDRPHRNFYN